METTRKSYWIETSPGPSFPRLEGDLAVDVAIIGGGITGITAGLLLKRAGKRVAVLEALHVAEGVTGYTTAHCTEVLDTRFHALISKFGEDGARRAGQAHRAAIERIARLVVEEDIDCDFRRVPGWLFTERPEQIAEIEREVDAADRLGLVVELTRKVPLPFPIQIAARFEDQAQIHPRRYLLPLAARLEGDGSFIFESTRALSIEDGEPCKIATERGIVTARQVLVAAHAPVGNRLFLQTKLAHYRSYVLAGRVDAPPPPGLFWDTEDPYHYIRTTETPDGRPMLIAGGEDHKVGQEANTDASYARLMSYVRDRFGPVQIESRWSAQVIEPADGLAYIGRNSMSRHVYVATGFSGNGMTYGTLAAMILSDEVLGRENRFAALFDATRMKPLASLKRFVAENVDFPKHLIGDRLRGAEAQSLDEVKPGEGKLVEVRGEKLAVYRAPTGEVHALSPVCTHLGCHVHFNAAEKSWDCPCHGSRFDTSGKVIDGPAVKALETRKVGPILEPEGEAPKAPERRARPPRDPRKPT